MHEQFFIVHLRFDLKFKKFFIYGLVVLLAVTSGLVIGDLYIDTIIPIVDTFSTQESEIRDDEDEIEALYNQAISGQKTSFSAVELYQIAEYKLKQIDSYMKVLSGDVVSTGFGQSLRSNKVLYNDQFYFLKMSPSNISLAPSMAVWINYEVGSDTVLINESRNRSDITGSSPEDYDILLGREGATEWTLGKYKSFFKTNVDTPLTYIISEFTTSEGNYSTNVTLDENEQYVFEITMTYKYASFAALYYSFEIAHFLEANNVPTTPPQSSSDLPQWESVTIKGVIDKDFNLLTLSYVENYSVNIPINGARVTNTLTDTFYYDQETITNYLESIGEL